MNSRSFRMLVGLAAVLVPAGMAEAGDLKIGYVDLQSIMFNSEKGKQAKSALTREFEERKGVLKKQYDSILMLGEDLQNKGPLLSEDARRKKEQDYWTQRREFTELTERHEAELRQKDLELTQEILKQVQTLLQDFAKKEKFSLVIEKNEGAVLYAADGIDITTEVLKRFDTSGEKPAKKE
ncbi:MAG: OmpH family outer membrane protein [Nitrospirae bacterium]|nr:OmpH family outer membrane protein [Nitrospirota bacterium]